MNEQDRNLQEKCRKFWDNQHAWCDSYLIDHLLKEEVEGFSWDEVSNLYRTYEDDEGEDEEEYREVLEWWRVDDYLCRLLAEQDEPLLINDFGNWWGRCTSGQMVCMDSVIERIVKEIYKIKT